MEDVREVTVIALGFQVYASAKDMQINKQAVFPSNKNSWDSWSKSYLVHIYALKQMRDMSEIQFSDIIYNAHGKN